MLGADKKKKSVFLSAPVPCLLITGTTRGSTSEYHRGSEPGHSGRLGVGVESEITGFQTDQRYWDLLCQMPLGSQGITVHHRSP